MAANELEMSDAVINVMLERIKLQDTEIERLRTALTAALDAEHAVAMREAGLRKQIERTEAFAEHAQTIEDNEQRLYAEVRQLRAALQPYVASGWCQCGAGAYPCRHCLARRALNEEGTDADDA
jgi:hypothetical protein